MNIINLNGGLGNQLFQYSFGMAMKYQFNIEVRFCDKFINSKQLGIQDIFDVEIQKVLPSDIKKTIGSVFINDQFRNYTLRIIKKLGISKLQNLIVENYYQPFTSLPNLKNNFFFGYWQNYNFFYSHMNKIKNNLNFKYPLEKSGKIHDLTKDYSNIVCVHLRLGDHKTNKNLKVFSEISSNYYLNAISIFKKKFSNPIFILFSDQLEKAKDILENNSDLMPSTIFNLKSEHDFQLMSLCDSYIFSNSTFSLWAAYLSNKEKIYFTKPSSWYKNPVIEKTNKYYLDNWVYLN